MSNQPDADIWGYIDCSKCHLRFSSDPGAPPQVPFWLTECGHIICNNHLNPDQSCAHCGSQNIQLVPLQRDMDPPMSDWFRSLPHSLDALAGAAKFQLEILTRQVGYYKTRYNQAVDFINRNKRESSENKLLKKKIEELAQENDELRKHLGFTDSSNRGDRTGDGSSGLLNSNGKRQKIEQHRHSSDMRGRTASSPRSTVTSLGPDRLTLPPGQQPQNFSEQREREDGPSSRPHVSGNLPHEAYHSNPRPGSSRFVEQYAFVPPQTPQVLTHDQSNTQAAPLRQFHRAEPNEDQDPVTRGPMPPPPSSSGRFKPAQGRPLRAINQGHSAPIRYNRVQDQNQPVARDRRKSDMGPPPPPIPLATNSHANQLPTPGDKVSQSSYRNTSTANTAAKPFMPNNNFGSAFVQHSMSSAQSGSGPQRFLVPSTAVSGSRAPSRAATPRMPFVPSIQRTFG